MVAADFNSFGARRGHDQVLTRGAFSNPRLKNRLLPGAPEGARTLHQPSGEEMPIYDAALRYQSDSTPLIIIAGREYGTGSSRDWAAKGPLLLGVKAVLAESFERIHRANLVGMGLLPLQFLPGQSAQSLGLDGYEVYDIAGLSGGLRPGMRAAVNARRPDGQALRFEALCRLDTDLDVAYYRAGGILHCALRSMMETG